MWDSLLRMERDGKRVGKTERNPKTRLDLGETPSIDCSAVNDGYNLPLSQALEIAEITNCFIFICICIVLENEVVNTRNYFEKSYQSKTS